MLHILEHSIHDLIPMIPFLFLTYLLMEYIEHKNNQRFETFLIRAQKLGPLIGSFLGIIPQCGFSVIASGLYMNQSISLGTLLAVFIATSDDAIPILIAHPQQSHTLLMIIILKIIIAMMIGYLVDGLVHSHHLRQNHSLHDVHEHCHEEEHGHGIVYLALIHTVKIFIFVFIVNFALTWLMEEVGSQTLNYLFVHGSLFQPVLTALAGFIPNCAASVILSQLYLDNVLSFGALFAGLMTSAGLGILVLWRMYDNKKDILRIMFIMLISATLVGMLLQVF